MIFQIGCFILLVTQLLMGFTLIFDIPLRQTKKDEDTGKLIRVGEKHVPYAPIAGAILLAIGTSTLTAIAFFR